MNNCSVCSKELRVNSKFCSFCGNQQLFLNSSVNEIKAPVSLQSLTLNEKNADLNNETAANADLNFLGIKFLFIVVLFGVAALVFYSSQDKKDEPTVKSYEELRDEILSSGWKVYKRHNEIKWNKRYPELDYCEEDNCHSSFINAEKTKVREIQSSICSAGGYIQCPNMPNGFWKIDRDVVISKAESDSKFLEVLKFFDDH